MVALMRCLLALVALVAVSVAAHHNPLPAVLFPSIVAYGVYSVALGIGGSRRPLTARAQPWIDVLFYTFLIALTHGSESIFFHFFFFPIVAAAFSRGFREGLGVTMFAVLSFVTISLAGYAGGMQFELTQAATRSISLFILGYMISYWGRNELALRRRLRLLRALAASANPRLTLDELVSSQLLQLLEFFGAEGALVALPVSDRTWRLYRSDVARSPKARTDEVREELALPLVDLPPMLRTAFDAKQWRAFVLLPDHEKETLEAQCRALANLLETRCFATVPYQPREAMVGRLYIMSSARPFTQAETEFLAHVAAQMAATANNVMLTQDLAVKAAHQERSKISRDIHDTTVQSYIGLKLGLEALYRDMGKEGPAAQRVKELLDMATLTVDDLRGYVNRLRERSQRDTQLLAQVDEQKRRYGAFHGINVEVRADKALTVSSATGVEAYQVVCEALSNVVRHTSAKRAFVDLRCDGDMLAIEVGNDSPKHATTPPFIPRSITERAMSLGGKVQVRLNKEGQDVVKVTIPLSAQKGQQPLAQAR
jgi:signal transduction histidine kinase